MSIEICSAAEKIFHIQGALNTKKSICNFTLKVYTRKKPSKCQMCGKQFSTTGRLRTHLRVNTGGKVLKCPNALILHSECKKEVDLGCKLVYTRMRKG